MRTMREQTTGKLYDLWSHFYDDTFGACVVRRRHRAMQQLHYKPGDVVLDIGVGTGLMLPNYPRDITVVGIDLSEGMLGKARLKCQEENLKHVTLVRGDAMFPPFAEQSFDHIMISHTISVVSDPVRLLRWASRLLKPGGRLVVLNHFQSTHPVVAWFEHVTNPMFIKIGWRSDLPLTTVLEDHNLEVEYCCKISLIDLWRIVVFKHRKPGVAQRTTGKIAAQPQPSVPLSISDHGSPHPGGLAMGQ